MRALILTNFVAQIALVAVIAVAWYQARKKLKFQLHCTMMRVAVGLQIATIIGIMAPALAGWAESPRL